MNKYVGMVLIEKNTNREWEITKIDEQRRINIKYLGKDKCVHLRQDWCHEWRIDDRFIAQPNSIEFIKEG